MGQKLVIYGAGELAELAYFYFTHDSSYTPVAFSVDAEYKKEESFLGLPLVSFEEVEDIYPPDEVSFFCAIGYKQMRLRSEPYLKAKKKGYRFVSYVSSKAVVQPDLQMGENNFIMPNVAIDPFVKIGDNNILWSSSLIASYSTIGDHNHISCGVTLASSVRVGSSCFIGAGATIIDRLVLADESAVAAAALLRNDTERCTLYMGVPARAVCCFKGEGFSIE